MCLALVVCLTQTSYAYAMEDNALTMQSNVENISQLEQYLELEEANDTTSLTKKKEELLNEKGVFDSELERLSEEEIENINEAESVSVSTEYVECTVDESKSEATDGFESKILNEAEIGDLINELYLENSNESDENKAMGIGSKTVVGNKDSETVTDEESTSYLKKTLIMARENSRVTVTFVCKWLTPPQFRKMDLLTIAYSGGTMLLDSDGLPKCTASLSARRTTEAHSGVSETATTIYEDYTSVMKENSQENGATGVEVDLPNDTFGYYGGQVISETWDITYSDITIVASFQMATNGRSGSVKADYKHQKIDFREIDFGDLLKPGFKLGKSIVKFCVKKSIRGGVDVVVKSGQFAKSLIDSATYYEPAGGSVCYTYMSYK